MMIPEKPGDVSRPDSPSAVEDVTDDAGGIGLPCSGRKAGSVRDRFEAARGKAQIKWPTEQLKTLLRG